MLTNRLRACTTFAVCLAALTALGEIPDAELEEIHDGYAARRDSMLRRQVTDTYPPIGPDSSDNLVGWNRLDFALAALYLDVSEKNDHASFTAFIEVVLANRCEIDNEKLVYQGLDRSGTFTFYLSGEQLPEIDGTPIDLNPSKTFDSPFLLEDYASGLVTIAKGSRRLDIDVSAPVEKK